MKTCYSCRGEVVSRRVDYMAKHNGGYTLVKNLETEVCGQCGEIFLDPKSSRRVDEALKAAPSTQEQITVPVIDCVL